MQIKVKNDNKWVEIPATTEIADDITSDKLTYSSKKIEELVNNSGHKYSTDEQVVGTWIDGKPLYEKTMIVDMYDTGAITNDNFMIPLNINDIELCLLTEQYWIDKTNTNTILPLYENINGSMMFYFDIANNSLRVNVSEQFTAPTDRNLRVLIFVIHYTKTTDTP